MRLTPSQSTYTGQSRLHSFVESVVNVIIGYSINVVANIYVLPLFGFYPSIAEAMGMGVIFTFISIVRSYILRRLFNHHTTKKLGKVE